MKIDLDLVKKISDIQEIQSKQRMKEYNIKNRNYSKLKKEDIVYRIECCSDIYGLEDAIEHFFDGAGDLNYLVGKYPAYFGDHEFNNIDDIRFVAEPIRLSSDYLNRHKGEYQFNVILSPEDAQTYHGTWHQIFLDIGDKNMAAKIKLKHL